MNQWAIIWAEHDNFIAGLLATLELFIIPAVCGLFIGTLLCYFKK